MGYSNQRNGLQRRRFLGWMGLGLFGAFAVQSLPFRFLSGKIAKKNSRSKKVKVSVNQLAVKRSKRVK